jgi:hypothetical protein
MDQKLKDRFAVATYRLNREVCLHKKYLRDVARVAIEREPAEVILAWLIPKDPAFCRKYLDELEKEETELWALRPLRRDELRDIAVAELIAYRKPPFDDDIVVLDGPLLNAVSEALDFGEISQEIVIKALKGVGWRDRGLLTTWVDDKRLAYKRVWTGDQFRWGDLTKDELRLCLSDVPEEINFRPYVYPNKD